MAQHRASTKKRLTGVERTFRAASIFLSEGGDFRLTVAIFGHPVRRAHWIEQLIAELAKASVHLTECRIPQTGEPRLIEELTSHLRDVPTAPGHRRAVVVTGISHHLPDAATVLGPSDPTPRFLAEANLDRELFPERCPHPLLLCLTPTSNGQFRRYAPDLMHWCSHTFDFTEPALPDGSYPIRGIAELEQSQPGTIYANRDELLRAAGIFRTGLDAAIAAHGSEHRETVGVRANLANVLHQLGRTQEALELAAENLRVLEHAKGIPDSEISSRIAQHAHFLDAMGRYAEAEPLLRRALDIDEASFGGEHPTVAIRLNNLAQLLMSTNRLAEAEPLMRRTLAIDEASLGKDHPNVATDLNNLAQLLMATNRFAEAEPLSRRALVIDEASFSKGHPNVAIRLNNLAQLLKDTNRLAEAEPLMRRALEIDEASFGKEHPNVAIRLNNLAQLLHETGRLFEAEPLMHRVLAIDEASFGKEHHTVARDLNNLAQLLHATNRLSEAEPLMWRALAIDETSFGTQHPDVAIRLNNLAQLLQATNRLSQAEPLMRRHLEIFLKFTRDTGHQHPHLEAAIDNYISLLVEMGDTQTQAREKIDAMLVDSGLSL